MNLHIENSQPEEGTHFPKVDTKAIEAREQPEIFKDRQYTKSECLHTTPQMENDVMVCPLCGERAVTIRRGDGTQYLDYE